MQKIYNAFIRYLETNGRDNRNVHTGWRRRLQDIYVAHHRPQDAPAITSPSSFRPHHADKK